MVLVKIAIKSSKCETCSFLPRLLPIQRLPRIVPAASSSKAWKERSATLCSGLYVHELTVFTVRKQAEMIIRT
jgi:hypothetical protein